MKRRNVFLAALLVLAISGCVQQVDVEAERAAIRATVTEFVEACKAKQVERALSLFADDASMLPPNSPIATGKEAIRVLLTQIIGNPGFALSSQPAKVKISRAGDLAYSLGTYEMTMQDPGGIPVTDRGKWVGLWKKLPDGSWKIIVDMWNSDEPIASD